jgi:X-Pro dipeptidyl-peptidase (S15 family)/X-Pro dipeptidyl-peptidase C-terminal non-catalytic domain
MRGPFRGAAVAAAAMSTALIAPPGAPAEIPASLKESCRTETAAPGHTYVFCDDGVPSGGGRNVNQAGVRAIEVPAAYRGWEGLPDKDAAAAAEVGGADPDGNVALDVDVSLPSGSPPAGGWPLLVMMHGCCAGSRTDWEQRTDVGGNRLEVDGEKWHYSNAWFASRGYVVLTYTSRGFVDASGNGSTGETHLQSRRFEVNDLQSLVAQVADDPFFHVDPSRVVVTAGSYGGGLSWMALTDPIWRSPGGRDLRLVAVAPKYAWTDLLYTIAPTGRHSASPSRLPAFDGSDTDSPVGIPKASILAGVYASGTTGVPPGTAHSTFHSSINEGFLCLSGPYPVESNPLCNETAQDLAATFLSNNSAYYQNDFFDRAARDPSYRVPLFDAAALTDPLFPPIENHRMINRMLSVAPSWPIQQHYGDTQHFVQNKAKEWTDVCAIEGARRRCLLQDYPGGDVDATPSNLVKTGTTTRLNRFIDHYAKPVANPSEPAPEFDVTVAPQVCPEGAGGTQPADESGPRLRAPSYRELANRTLHFSFPEQQQTTNPVVGNFHAVLADPVENSISNGNRCASAQGPAGLGVATYETPPLPEPTIMVGPATVGARYSSGGDISLAARLYDVFPGGGPRVLIDRGYVRLTGASGRAEFELQGNVYELGKDHRLALELAQDDSPFLKPFSVPSTATISDLTLDSPARSAPAPVPSTRLWAQPLALEGRRAQLAGLRWDAEPGAAPVLYAVQGRRLDGARVGPYRAMPRLGRTTERQGRLRVPSGATYQLRARTVDELGRAGAWSIPVVTIAARSERAAGGRYSGPWRAKPSGGALGGRLTRCEGPLCRLEIRFRGRDFWLIAPRARHGGRARVVVDGRARTISFRSPQGGARQEILHANLGMGTHTIRLRSLGIAPIYVDGIAIEARRR